MRECTGGLHGLLPLSWAAACDSQTVRAQKAIECHRSCVDSVSIQHGRIRSSDLPRQMPVRYLSVFGGIASHQASHSMQLQHLRQGEAFNPGDYVFPDSGVLRELSFLERLSVGFSFLRSALRRRKR